MSDVSEHPGCRECRNYSLRGPEYCAFCETDDLRQQLATLTQERDALRDAIRDIAAKQDALINESCWSKTHELSDALRNSIMKAVSITCLTPSGEAGKGGEV